LVSNEKKKARKNLFFKRKRKPVQTVSITNKELTFKTKKRRVK
jgi:hypothetical protein